MNGYEDDVIKKYNQFIKEWEKAKKHYGAPSMAQIDDLLRQLKAAEPPRLIIGD